MVAKLLTLHIVEAHTESNSQQSSLWFPLPWLRTLRQTRLTGI